MKILQIGLSYNPGGVESFVMNYYIQLATKGIQFDFVSMFPKLAYEKEIKQLGGRVFHISNVKKDPSRYATELTAIIESGNYDVVHVNMLSAANIVPLRVAYKCGVKKIVAHSHNSSSPGIIRNVMHLWNKRYIERYATDYFACSEFAGAWLFTSHLIQGEKYHIINNALCLEKYYYNEYVRKKIRKDLGLENKFVVGHVGRFEEQKNHSFLIKIFNEIVKREPNAILLLVGNGELEDVIKRNVIDLNLKDKVMFLGVRNDVNKIWQAIDVFVFPSLFEGLPIVAVEAQASGVVSVLADTITKEVKITDNVVFLSLDEPAEVWAQRVIEERNTSRCCDIATIKQIFTARGFEIESAAEMLLKYYVD